MLCYSWPSQDTVVCGVYYIFINLDVLGKKIILVLNAFKKNIQHKSLLALFSQGMGRAGDLRARRGTTLEAGSPGHVMKQDKPFYTCKEGRAPPGSQDWETAEVLRNAL